VRGKRHKELRGCIAIIVAGKVGGWRGAKGVGREEAEITKETTCNIQWARKQLRN
jgi:hypothetical protein